MQNAFWNQIFESKIITLLVTMKYFFLTVPLYRSVNTFAVRYLATNKKKTPVSKTKIDSFVYEFKSKLNTEFP